ncbi:hypothetical protein [Trinickia violacea]|nr:hypothetical protein [Trinickia violacea]
MNDPLNKYGAATLLSAEQGAPIAVPDVATPIDSTTVLGLAFAAAAHR